MSLDRPSLDGVNLSGAGRDLLLAEIHALRAEREELRRGVATMLRGTASSLRELAEDYERFARTLDQPTTSEPTR